MQGARVRSWERKHQPELAERRRRRLEAALQAQPHHPLPYRPLFTPSIAAAFRRPPGAARGLEP